MYKIVLWVCVLLCFTGVHAAEKTGGVKALKFAVLNFSGDESKKWSALSKHLTAVVGTRIKLITSKPQALLKRAKSFDLIMTNPVSAAIVNQNDEFEVLATLNHRITGSEFAGVIITHKDSGIHDIKQLAGKQVGVVDKLSAAGGYLYQIYELKQAGLTQNDFKNFVNIPGQRAIILRVAKNYIDAGFIRVGMLDEYKNSVNLSDVVILNKQPYKGGPFYRSTDVYPHWPFLASKSVPKALRAKIKAALLAIKPDDGYAQKAGINGFVEPLSYDKISTVMKAVDHPGLK